MTKIATCCYCGARSVLKLTARDGHELACSNCGAPLHELKALKQTSHKKPKHSHGDWGGHGEFGGGGKRSKSKKKKKKSGWSRAFEEAFDILDDIFD